MPIYEYQCTDCEHRLEAIQKVSDKPLTLCPACGNPGLKKLVSAAAFHLKGTGWYKTDFKEKPKTKEDSKKAEDSSEKVDANKSGDKKSRTESAKTTSKEVTSTTSN